MSESAFHALLVGFDRSVAARIRESLTNGRPRAVGKVSAVDNAADAVEHVRSDGRHVALVNWRVEKGGPHAVTRRVREVAPGVPIIVVATSEQDYDPDIVAEGAQDVLLPEDLTPEKLRRSVLLARRRNESLVRLRDLEQRYALLAHAGGDGFFDWDLTDNTVFFSDRWKEGLGYGDEDIGASAEDWFNLVHPDDVTRLREDINTHLQGHTPHLVTECRMRHKGGGYGVVTVRALAGRDFDGTPTRLVGIQRDITNRRAAEDRLRKSAFYDSLTGLPNRAVLLDRLSRAMERGKRHGDFLFALLFLDVDGFKRINDGLGHAAGDELLVSVARRLEAAVRAVDTVARVSGDEFAVILDDIRDTSDALRVAERIQASLGEPFPIRDQEVVVTASIGIALGIREYDDAAALLRDADTAMYRAKAAGKNGHEIFDKAMHTRAVTRLSLENELRRAIEDNQLRVYYQPIISLEQGRVASFEALVRWQHPEHGLVSPAEFIPIAEETGLIIPMDRWVLRTACRQTRAWHDKYPSEPPLAISTNLARTQLAQPDLVDYIRGVIRETGLDPKALRPEITESQLMEDADRAARILNELKDMHVLLHLDDFGTGYSSLSYLVRFHVDTLKIDGSFVSNMEERGENMEVVRMIVSLAHNLGMKVIAEGVETKSQLERLQRLKCQYVQGYYLARPMPAAEAEKLLAEGRSW